MEKIKPILRIFFLKYWYLLVLCLSLAFVLFYFITSEKHRDFFVCKMQGSTYMISRLSINEYMAPLSLCLTEKEYSTGERILGVKSDFLKKIKTIIYDAQPIIEETNIRYEYLITVIAYDTVDFYLLEEAFINRISKHPLVQENYKNKIKKFERDQALIQADIYRVDSIASALKNTQTEYYEILMQKKVDLNLQLSKITAKFNENYIHKKIYGFRDSFIKMNQTKNKLDLFKWVLMFLMIDFVLVFAIDKSLRELFFS